VTAAAAFSVPTGNGAAAALLRRRVVAKKTFLKATREATLRHYEFANI
jgi:hypothetical protein